MTNKIAVITILTGNAAFCEDSGEETQAASGAEQARILRALADEIEAGGVFYRALRDINGNVVGHYEYVARERVTLKIESLD